MNLYSVAYNIGQRQLRSSFLCLRRRRCVYRQSVREREIRALSFYKPLVWISTNVQIFLPFCHNARDWRTDGRTNRQWDRHTEFSSLDRVCIQCSPVKTGSIIDLLPAALLNCTRRPSDRAFSVAAALVGTVFLAYRFSYWIPYTCHTLVQTGI